MNDDKPTAPYGITPEAEAEMLAREDDTQPREPGCGCDQEVGDSPCKVHGEDEPEPKVAPVIPITPTHECPSCKQAIDTLKKYEGHGPTCMQPEIRMRRLEGRVFFLEQYASELQERVAKLEGRPSFDPRMLEGMGGR